MEVCIYNGSISQDSSGPLWSVHIYTYYCRLLSYEIVLYSNTGASLILGMSRGLVHVAAGLLRLGPPGRVRNLFHREFLSDVLIQRIIQSSTAKGHPTGKILSARKGATCPKILFLLIARHIHGMTYREADGGLFVLTMDLGELLTMVTAGL
jgi:hypothetical protein